MKLKAQLPYKRSMKFNTGWLFTGMDLRDSSEKIDSARRLGKNWSDQFLIEKVNTNDSALPQQNFSLQNELAFTQNRPWTPVTLPHTAFPEPLVIVQPREGIAWYKKTFRLPASLKGKRITLEFEGAMQMASVWFNGKFMTQHLGGYLPFTIDLTALAKYDADNILFVKLDNRPNPLVPPGKPVKKLDFIYYSGIYRDVWLHVTDPLHITDASVARKQAGGGVFVTYTNVSEREATVNVQTHVINEGKEAKRFTIVQQLADAGGKIVAQQALPVAVLQPATDQHFKTSLLVQHPLLWHPDSPHLYVLHTIIREGTQIADSVTTRIGIRSFVITKEQGLLINGKPFRLLGSNRHMNYPWIGNALSDNAHYRDAAIIKQAGMNCIRLAHYPQDPSFYDACDELGILLIDCIPGWQFFNKSPAFRDHVMDDIRQTIRRDRNHPSILLWEMSLNETYPPAEFRCMQNDVAKSEWPSKENFYTSGDSYFVKGCWDVPYDDWNNNLEARNNTTYPNHPFLVREYGDYEFGGGESTTRQLRGAGEKGLLQQAWNLQWEHNRNRNLYPRCIGDLNWAFFDGLAGLVVGIEGWGLADIFRIPKFSYYFFQSQQEHTAPMIYIANYWTKRDTASTVVVYSNCDEVKLYSNGNLVQSKLPDAGPLTPYGVLDKGGHPFGGGDAAYLAHPPFTFTGIPFTAGELKAVGYQKGKAVTSYTVHTPGQPAKLELTAATHNKPLMADGGDAVFVYARVLDAGNHFVPTATDSIRFSVEGDAAIASPPVVQAEAGIATILLRAGLTHGTIRIHAAAPGMKEATLSIHQ